MQVEAVIRLVPPEKGKCENNLKEDSMRILVLNGSSRPEGNMKKMIAAFEEGAKLGGHQVDVVDVCQKKIGGCMECLRHMAVKTVLPKS